MDREAIEYTRQHYDAHANKMSTAEALRSRSEGAALPLKQYHNSIKRELVNSFAGGAGASLLDLACGRGGDLWKWFDARLGYVLGVDLSPGEVAEAARRFAEGKAKREKGGGSGAERVDLVAEFRECSTLGLEPFTAEPAVPCSASGASGEGAGRGEGAGGGGSKATTKGGDDDEADDEQKKRKRKTKTTATKRPRRRFDSVSCMFAAHYFCVSEAALSMFLSNVARNLRPGGFFFGTVPSGKRVMGAINDGGRWPLLSTPMLRLEAKWTGAPKPFGCGYTCAIGNTVTSSAAVEAEEEQGAKGGQGDGCSDENDDKRRKKDEATEQGSFEYLVFASAFTAVAAKHNLHPVPRWGGPSNAAERLLDPADEQSHFKSFAPHFPGSDPSLERASELFQAFLFVKGEDKKGEEEDLFVVEEEGGEEAEGEEEEEGKGEEEERKKKKRNE